MNNDLPVLKQSHDGVDRTEDQFVNQGDIGEDDRSGGADDDFGINSKFLQLIDSLDKSDEELELQLNDNRI